MDNMKKGGAHLDVKKNGLNDFFIKALEHDFQKLNEPFYIESDELQVDRGVPLGIAASNSTTTANKYISINNLFFHILIEALELPDTTIESIFLGSRYGYIFKVNLPADFKYLRNSYLSGGISLKLNDPLQSLVIKLVVAADKPIQLGTTGKYCMTKADFLKETKQQYDINAETIVTRLSICPDIIDFSLMERDVAIKFLDKMSKKMTMESDINAINEIKGYLNQSDVTGLGFNVMEFANRFETFASFEKPQNSTLIDSVKYLIAANVVWLYTIGWIHLDLHKWNVMVKTGFNLDLNTINVWFLDMGTMQAVINPVSSSTSSSSSIKPEQLFVNIKKNVLSEMLSNLQDTNIVETKDETNDTISTIELLLRLSYEHLYPTSKGSVTDRWSENNSNKSEEVKSNWEKWKVDQIARFEAIYKILLIINNGAFSEILSIFAKLKTTADVQDQLEQLKLNPDKVLFELIFKLIAKTYITAYGEDAANMRKLYRESPQMSYLGPNLLDGNIDVNVKTNIISFLFHRLIRRSAVKEIKTNVLYRMTDVLDPYLVSDVSELKAITEALNGSINIDSDGKVSVSGDTVNLDSLNKPIELLGGKFSLVNETNSQLARAPLLEAATTLLAAATTSPVATI
jgi:hypothetical protein